MMSKVDILKTLQKNKDVHERNAVEYYHKSLYQRQQLVDAGTNLELILGGYICVLQLCDIVIMCSENC